MELSIPYEFTAPDGARAVIGNSDAAMADPDFVGILDPENGITGILDEATHRVSGTDLVEGDGMTFGPTWLGGRPGTVQGLILPPGGLDPALVNAAGEKLERATRALHADGFLRWTPGGSAIERELRFRRTSGPNLTRRRPKAFQFALTSPDAYILSSGESSLEITPGLGAGELGIPNPILDPIASPLDVSAQAFVVNQGTADTWPRFRIRGPITNPRVIHQIAPPLTNWAKNPSVELTTTTYTQYVGNTIARSTEQSYSGDYSLKATYSNDTRLTSVAIVPSGGVQVGQIFHGSARVWIPSSWTGGQVIIGDDGTNGANNIVAQVNADMALRDQWQTIYWTKEKITSAGTTTNIFIKYTGTAPTVGDFIYIDGVMSIIGAEDPGVPDYFDGDFAGSQWLGSPHNSESLYGGGSETVALTYDLAAGDFLDVFPRTGQILLNGDADRYGSLDFAASSWWKLAPGSNDVRLLAAASSAGASVIVYWRHAWAR